MKVRASVRRLCAFCKVVKRRGIVFIQCSAKKKHKQRQGYSTLAEAAAAASATAGPLHPPPPPAGTSAAVSAALSAAQDSKVAKQEMSTKFFNWPLGLAALLKNGDK